MKDDLIELSKKLVKELSNNDGELTREAVSKILGNNSGYYSIVVSALVYIRKINRIKGRNGGIRFRSVQGQQKKLTKANLKALSEYYSKAGTPTPVTIEPEIKYEKVEEQFYEQLKNYLLDTGDFDVVEIYGNSRGGGLYENVDVISIVYQSGLKYNLHLVPELASYEVKAKWPDIKDVQQAASYLRFSQRAFLCFYYETYRGDYDGICTELKDQGIWDWTDLYKIGIIVIYKKQDRSSNYSFQRIKEAPYNNFVDVTSIDTAIEKYFSDKSKKDIREIIKKQIKDLL